MPSHHGLYAVLLSACATTGTLGVDPQRSQHTRVTLEPIAAYDTKQLVPHVVDPQLPSADRLSHVIASELGAEARVDVRVCVSPRGRVLEAKLERASELMAFNYAVMTDVQAWRFEVQPGPDTLRTCGSTTIVYRPRA